MLTVLAIWKISGKRCGVAVRLVDLQKENRVSRSSPTTLAKAVRILFTWAVFAFHSIINCYFSHHISKLSYKIMYSCLLANKGARKILRHIMLGKLTLPRLKFFFCPQGDTVMIKHQSIWLEGPRFKSN